MNKNPPNFDRRKFIKTSLAGAGSAALYSSGLFSLFNASQALANGNEDYKALIYIFLEGGNDANNMLVPTGINDLRARYELFRGNLALTQNSLHNLILSKPAKIYNAEDHNEFGLHGSCPDIGAGWLE